MATTTRIQITPEMEKRFQEEVMKIKASKQAEYTITEVTSDQIFGL